MELAVIGNLPQQLTRLIGRDAALNELRAEVWGARLLTLCGPGGSSKTRLAVALADAVQADFVGGAWWVDLSETLGSALVAQAVAATVLPGEAEVETGVALANEVSVAASLQLLDRVMAHRGQQLVSRLVKAIDHVCRDQAGGSAGDLPQARLSGGDRLV